MPRGLEIDPRDAVPIWRQIEDGIRGLVASGALRPGGVVPSVRDLARELRVNPATVVRAYQRLTDAGLLTVKRGEGTFVSAQPPRLTPAERDRALDEGAQRYACVVITVGARRDEAVAALSTALERLRPDEKGGRA